MLVSTKYDRKLIPDNMRQVRRYGDCLPDNMRQVRRLLT